ncbi:MAG: helix-turn-helix domain-containing protein [Candidatus Acidiferrales bacterium]
MGFSRKDFARTLWAASKSVMEWENGKRSPMGMHRRLLILCEQGLINSSFRAALQDARASDPMFLLFQLLHPLYRQHSANQFDFAQKRNSRRIPGSPIGPQLAARLTHRRIRVIRRALGFSQGEFAHFLWITYSTLNRWEHGVAPPYGMHLRILCLLEHHFRSPAFQAILHSPCREDHLFLLHQLLRSSYGPGRSRNSRRG